MSKRNIVIGVTPVEFDNMPDSLKGKYTLAVEGVSDLYNKMTNEWVEERQNISLLRLITSVICKKPFLFQ